MEHRTLPSYNLSRTLLIGFSLTLFALSLATALQANPTGTNDLERASTNRRYRTVELNTAITNLFPAVTPGNFADAAELPTAAPLRFEAEMGVEGVRLDWTSTTAGDDAYFMVERSSGLHDWTSIAMIPAATPAGIPLMYDALDANPDPGVSHYRLRKVDANGKAMFSEVRTILRDDALDVPLWPNTTMDRIHLVGLEAAAEGVRIIDIEGRVVPVFQEISNDRLVLHVDGLPTGQYQVRGLADGTLIGRFIKP